jgi:ubiquinol-cytochrome c reductase cytochrome b subunit
MSAQDELPAPSKALAGTGVWLDDRFRGAKGLRTFLKKIYPDHWTFLLGEIALYSFVILLLTGTFLTFFFQPSMTDVVYHGTYTRLNGVRMSEAYASTLNISFDVRGGLLMRQIHHWAANLFMVAIFAHLMRVFFTGAYRKPRDVNWLIGIVMLTLGMLEGLFGYSLPDDLLSGTGLRILEGVMLGIPIVGTYLTFFLFGGQFPGHDIIPRLYIIHVLLIPALLLALISAHLFIMFWQKHTQHPGVRQTEKNVVGQPFYPYFMAKTGAWFFFIFGGLAVLSTVAQVNPIWLYGPYSPVAISAGSQPDFYMGFLEGALRVFPSWTWDLAGHTVAWNVVIPALVPLGLILTGAALWPFIERWATGDNSEHHINDRPRNAPTRTAVGVAAITFYIILLLEGANDLIAFHLNIDLYLTTEIARWAVFLGPAVAYFVTKRVCLGLQRKDADLLEHGLETGIIRQLPSGAFEEIHRPVSEETRAVLLARSTPPPPPALVAADENGVPAPQARGIAGRLRASAYRVLTESIPLPPDNGHGNGHDGHDGHDGERGDEHAAIGAAQPPDGGGAVSGPEDRDSQPGDAGS